MSSRLILVTGGAGFIGSNIVAELVGRPDVDIAVCDRLRGAASGKWRNLARHPIVDFVQPEELWTWLRGPGCAVESVIHMGAVSSTTEADADHILKTNFTLSRDLFTWCREQARRLIWASSAATYGDGAAGFEDDPSLTALTALRPLNPYGWSKSLFDSYAVREAGRGQAPPQWVGLKFFNVYGPNEGHKGDMRSVIAKIWPDVSEGRPVRLFRSYQAGVADGEQKRDFIYVRDVAKVVAWLIDRPAVNGIFNLGSGVARSFRDLAQAVFRAADRPAAIEYIEMPEELRAAYQYLTLAPMSRLRVSGYTEPFATLEEGVEEYVTRYLRAGEPYR